MRNFQVVDGFIKDEREVLGALEQADRDGNVVLHGVVEKQGELSQFEVPRGFLYVANEVVGENPKCPVRDAQVVGLSRRRATIVFVANFAWRAFARALALLARELILVRGAKEARGKTVAERVVGGFAEGVW